MKIFYSCNLGNRERICREGFSSHELLCYVMENYMDIPCETEVFRNINGKPYFEKSISPYCYFSITHTGRIWTCVFDSCEVGIDAEFPDRKIHNADHMITRFFSDDEAGFVNYGSDGWSSRFLLIWTRKEACIKLHGGRLFRDMGKNTVTGREDIVFLRPEVENLLVSVCRYSDSPSEGMDIVKISSSSAEEWIKCHRL